MAKQGVGNMNSNSMNCSIESRCECECDCECMSVILSAAKLICFELQSSVLGGI